MDLTCIYEGPTPMAEMLRELLRERGVESLARGNPDLFGIAGIRPGLTSAVLITADQFTHERETVRDCLAVLGVNTDGLDGNELSPADAPPGRGSELLPLDERKPP